MDECYFARRFLGLYADEFYFCNYFKSKLCTVMMSISLSPFKRIWRFYADGFRAMTLGRTLWILILVKLFIMFFVLRLFFFPNFLNQATDHAGDKDDYVSRELIGRGVK